MTREEKRCFDCASLIKKNGAWCCDECFGQKVNDIDDCPEGVTLEEIETTEEKAKVIKRYEKSDKERKKSTRERKIDYEKLEILNTVQNGLENIGIMAEIEKEIALHFMHNGNDYTLKLTRHSKKKK